MRLSYRQRRRLVALTVFAFVAGGIAAATVFLPEGQSSIEAHESSPSSVGRAASAETGRDASHRRRGEQLCSTIALFVSTSVMRHHPERSWAIVHPVARQGLTKRQWSTGNIPIVPFPAAGVDLFTLQSAADRTVLAELLLEPSRKSNLVRKTFQIELRRAPRALHGWLISAWVPEGVSESQIQRDARSEPVVASHVQHLSGAWLVVLVAVLCGGLVLIPMALVVRETYLFHRANAAFHRSRSGASG